MRIQILYPQQNQIKIVDLPNFEYMPLFYLFPKELLKTECPSLMDMPRSAHGIFTQKKWFTVLASDFFLQTVCDLTAYYIWPSFGITTYMECFSGNDPIWQLAHSLPIWQRTFERMSGITPQSLANASKKEHDWIEQEEFQDLMIQVGVRGIMDNKLLPCIQAVREMRCFEDYDNRNSNAKIDFYRRWYHTRSKISTVSLEQLTDNEIGDGLHSNLTSQYEDTVCSKIVVDKFYQRLEPLDREILDLRINGYTYQEIAERTGYKTHSGVLKRINRITELYIDYAAESQDLKT